MAHIHEEVVIVKITTLKKGNHPDCTTDATIDSDTLANIEAVIQELLFEPGRVIEVYVDDKQFSTNVTE